MSCSECSDDCVGKEDFTEKSIHFEIGYKASDCRIDDSNNPWWVKIELGSSRGSSIGNSGGVYLRVKMSCQDSKISVENVSNEKEKYVPGNSSGRNIEFKISQSTGKKPPEMSELELDIDWKKSKSDSYQDLTSANIDRRLSKNP